MYNEVLSARGKIPKTEPGNKGLRKRLLAS